ncbi:MAG: hypothetical protein AB8H86_24310 [Polyangiales bacterium]
MKRALLLLSLCACAAELPIQTVVFVTAGDALAARANCLEWTVVKSNGVSETSRLPDNCEGDAPTFPVCLPFAPRGGDEARARFNAQIRLLGEDGVLAESSIAVSYADARQSTLRLHFQDADWEDGGFCERGICPADMRCEDGQCLEQCVAVRPTLLPEANEGVSCGELCDAEGCADENLEPLRCDGDVPCEATCVDGEQWSFVTACDAGTGSQQISEDAYCLLRCDAAGCSRPRASNGASFPSAEANDLPTARCEALVGECRDDCTEACGCDMDDALCVSGCDEFDACFQSCDLPFRFRENDLPYADCGESYGTFEGQLVERGDDTPLILTVDTLYVPAGTTLEIRAIGPVVVIAREAMRIEGSITAINQGETPALIGPPGAGGRLGIAEGASTLEPLPRAGRGGDASGLDGGRGGLSLQLSTPGPLYVGPQSSINVSGGDGSIDNDLGVTAGGGAGGALLLESPFLQIEGVLDATGGGRRPRAGGPSPIGQNGWVEFVTDLRRSRTHETQLRGRVRGGQPEPGAEGVRVSFRQMEAE